MRMPSRFFTERHKTPWGAGINFDDADSGSGSVRDFFIHNALYWLEEFNFDGLRFDAVHAIADDSAQHFLTELAETVRSRLPRDRHIHLVLENDRNEASRLARDNRGVARHFDAQWNDDLHHVLHTLATGEADGYYADYAQDPVGLLGRCLAEGFAFQGDPSPFRQGERRGEPSAQLPASAFVNFAQNHDQIGNRAFGERLAQLAPPHKLAALTAILLLAPEPPMLFMGEEFAASTPFLFFCDFGPELAAAVSEGRRKEFAAFARFADPALVATIPDPCDPDTFVRSKLDWTELGAAVHADSLERCRALLATRRREIVPLLPLLVPGTATVTRVGPSGLRVEWPLQAEGADRGRLQLLANLGDTPIDAVVDGRLLYRDNVAAHVVQGAEQLQPWSVIWTVRGPGVGRPRA